MPIHLTPPSHNPRGVDGQGHNRLAVLMPIGNQCALRPLTEATFWDAHDTRKSRYGNHGPCTSDGNCNSCKFANRPSKPWLFGTESLVIRIDDQGTPWIMNKQQDGWGEYGEPTTWQWLLNLQAEFSRGEDMHGRFIRAVKA